MASVDNNLSVYLLQEEEWNKLNNIKDLLKV